MTTPSGPVPVTPDAPRSLALNHIRHRISSSPERLREAAERIDLNHGTVELLGHVALAGAADRASAASEFEAGLGGSSAPASSMASAAVQHYVGGDPNRFLLLLDWNRPEDPSVRLSPLRVTVVGDDAWVIVDDALLDDRYLQKALALWLNPFMGVAVMGRASRSIWEAGAPTKIVDEVLAGIEAILVGAFDGEGYLLWRAEHPR